MALYEKFAKRLKDDLNIEIDPSSIKRTYVNPVLTNQGAWVWYGSLLDSSIIIIGSCQSISSLMKSNKIEIINKYNLEIEIGSLDD